MAITWNTPPQPTSPAPSGASGGTSTGGIKWNGGGLDASIGALASSQASHDQLKAKAAFDLAAATAASQQANSPATIAAETAKGTVGGIANNALRFVQSAVHAPADIFNSLTGKQQDQSVQPNFTGEGQQTFQGEFQSKTIPAVESGQADPRAATLGTVGNVVSGAGDVLGLEGAGKLASGAMDYLGKTKLGGIVQDFAAKRASKAGMSTAIKAVTPKLTAGELQEAGAAGRITTPKRGAPFVDMSGDKQFQQIAKDTKGIVEGKDPNIDIHNLRSSISNSSESSVKPFLSQNKVPVNFEDFINKLHLVQPSSGLKADPNAFSTYNRIREEVQGSLYSSMKGAAQKSGDFTSSTDLNHVWDANKVLDAKAETELGDKVFGSPEYTGAKAAIQDLRQGIRQYIQDSIKFPGQMENVNKMQEFMQVARNRGMEINSPEDLGRLLEQMGIKNTPEDVKKAAFFQDSMSKISNWYKAVDNIKTKIPDYVRDNSTFAKRHPMVTGAAKIGAGIAGGGVAVDAAHKLGI